MNVASLELSRQLWELSGWDDYFPFRYYGDKLRVYPEGSHVGESIPAYDAGFLLRKLPQASVVSLEDGNGDVNGYYADSYKLTDRKRVPKRIDADTPEDAAAKLAIELFKQGILKRKGTDD